MRRMKVADKRRHRHWKHTFRPLEVRMGLSRKEYWEYQLEAVLPPGACTVCTPSADPDNAASWKGTYQRVIRTSWR